MFVRWVWEKMAQSGISSGGYFVELESGLDEEAYVRRWNVATSVPSLVRSAKFNGATSRRDFSN